MRSPLSSHWFARALLTGAAGTPGPAVWRCSDFLAARACTYSFYVELGTPPLVAAGIALVFGSYLGGSR